jgi:plasmid stabilization system protein ParE
MMRVIYAPRALRDVDDILAYTHRRSHSGARNVSLAIEHAVELCALNPHGGAGTNLPGVYRRPLSKYRYTIFYRTLFDTNAIEIVRVVHGARVRNLRHLPRDD